MNRFPATTKVEAMIAAAGGDGDGANIKSGVSDSHRNLEKQVDFVTPFLSIPSVVLSPIITPCFCWLTEVTTTYFKWKNNSQEDDISAHWIATTAGNT